MFAFLTRIVLVLRSAVDTRASREAEIFVLRHQLMVLNRKFRTRVRLRNIDRLILVWLYRAFPSLLNAITVVASQNLIRGRGNAGARGGVRGGADEFGSLRATGTAQLVGIAMKAGYRQAFEKPPMNLRGLSFEKGQDFIGPDRDDWRCTFRSEAGSLRADSLEKSVDLDDLAAVWFFQPSDRAQETKAEALHHLHQIQEQRLPFVHWSE